MYATQPVQESGPLEEPKAFRRLRKWREFTTAAAAATAAGRRSEDCRPDAAGGGAVTGELEFIPLEQKHSESTYNVPCLFMCILHTLVHSDVECNIVLNSS